MRHHYLVFGRTTRKQMRQATTWFQWSHQHSNALSLRHPIPMVFGYPNNQRTREVDETNSQTLLTQQPINQPASDQPSGQPTNQPTNLHAFSKFERQRRRDNAAANSNDNNDNDDDDDDNARHSSEDFTRHRTTTHRHPLSPTHSQPLTHSHSLTYSHSHSLTVAPSFTVCRSTFFDF